MSKFVLLSAGGTGGHMSPASAMATALIEKGIRVELVTDDRGQKYTKMFHDIKVHVVKSGTAHAGVLGKIKGAINLARGIRHGFALVKELKPDAVIGFGGYPSVPAVLAAQILGVPTGLHEQNAILGKANVFLAPKSKFIALSLPLTILAYVKQRINDKAVVTGNPVRPEIIALKDAAYPSLDDGKKVNIFVMGGSLGATVFSQVVPRALSLLSPERKARIAIVQQCREADLQEAKDLYDESGIDDVTLAPFIDDVARYLAKAHLFIGRSGASTVAEISIAGRPAIYVPYPHHKDQQQKMNAQNVADKGGAWIIEEDQFTPAALHKSIEGFFNDPETLIGAAEHAKECGLPDAAIELAALALKITK